MVTHIHAVRCIMYCIRLLVFIYCHNNWELIIINYICVHACMNVLWSLLICFNGLNAWCNELVLLNLRIPSRIRHGNWGAGGTVLPTKLLGEQVIHPAPAIFFCNWQLKVTVKFTFNTKIILKTPQLSGALTQTLLYTVYTFLEKYF